MADKITNFEDYKKRGVVNENPEPVRPGVKAGNTGVTGTSAGSAVDGGDTAVIESIEIVDPYNFFTEEEREAYFRERQKAEQKETAPVPEKKPDAEPGKPADKPAEEPAKEPVKKPVKEAAKESVTAPEKEPVREETGPIRKHHIPRHPVQETEEEDIEEVMPEDAGDDAGYDNEVYEDREYEEEYEEDYDEEDYDEDYDEDEESEEDEASDGPDLMLVVVRFASILTGIVIIAAIAFGAYKYIAPKFRPDPDEEPAAEVQVALPDGYEEKNDMVTVTALSLNLRTVPSSESDSTIVTSVSKGTTLKRIAQSRETTWAIVEYEGQQLYASSKYLEESQN